VRRVLFDENLPRLLRRSLPEYEIRTVQEEGWGSLRNGELLRRAVGRLQLELLERSIGALRAAIADVKPGELVRVTVMP